VQGGPPEVGDGGGLYAVEVGSAGAADGRQVDVGKVAGTVAGEVGSIVDRGFFRAEGREGCIRLVHSEHTLRKTPAAERPDQGNRIEWRLEKVCSQIEEIHGALHPQQSRSLDKGDSWSVLSDTRTVVDTEEGWRMSAC
jgi:hypothetical protein